MRQGCTRLKKTRSHLKIIGVRWKKLRKPNTQISGATIQNLVARPTWRPEFVLPTMRDPMQALRKTTKTGLSAMWISLPPEGLINTTVHAYKSTYFRKVPYAKNNIIDTKRSVIRRD